MHTVSLPADGEASLLHISTSRISLLRYEKHSRSQRHPKRAHSDFGGAESSLSREILMTSNSVSGAGRNFLVSQSDCPQPHSMTSRTNPMYIVRFAEDSHPLRHATADPKERPAGTVILEERSELDHKSRKIRRHRRASLYKDQLYTSQLPGSGVRLPPDRTR